MTLKDLCRVIKNLGIKQKLINYAGAGCSIGDLNPLTIADYPVLYCMPTGNHTVYVDFTRYELTIYFIDRLLDDNSNSMDIFSTAVENLKNIIRGLKDMPGIVDVENTWTIRNFTSTEKLNDRTAGAYATVRISVDNEFICYEEE